MSVRKSKRLERNNKFSMAAHTIEKAERRDEALNRTVQLRSEQLEYLEGGEQSIEMTPTKPGDGTGCLMIAG